LEPLDIVYSSKFVDFLGKVLDADGVWLWAQSDGGGMILVDAGLRLVIKVI
jgi:hypothetical protein